MVILGESDETTLNALETIPETCWRRTLGATILFWVAMMWQFYRRGVSPWSIKSAYLFGITGFAGLSVWAAQWSSGVCWPWLKVFGAVAMGTLAIIWLTVALNRMAHFF